MPVKSAAHAAVLPTNALTPPASAAAATRAQRPSSRPPKPAASAPLAVRARRAWKRFGESRSRPAVLLRTVLKAFQMGIYFKVVITVVLVLRLASQGSQMQFPSAAFGVEEYRSRVLAEETLAVAKAAGERGATVRISVVTTNGDPLGLKALLVSLAAARYDGVAEEGVSLDVWLFASSMASAIPVIFLPLAIAVFGPPRFDHSTADVAASFNWQHGPKHVVAQRSEPDWAVIWSPSAAGVNETVVFVDAARARAVAPTFFTWLSATRMSRPDIGAYALDALTFTDASVGPSVATEAFLPATAVWSPARDVWVTFLKWRRLRSRLWWPRPVLPQDLNLKGYDAWEALRFDPLRAWFSQFLYEYKALVVHPVLRDSQVLVVRKPGYTSGAPGAGASPGPCLSVNAEMRVNALSDTAFKVPKSDRGKLTVLKWDGKRGTPTSIFGDAPSAKAIDEASAAASRSFGRRRGQRQLEAKKKAVRRLSVRDLVAPVPISGDGHTGPGRETSASLFAEASARDLASVIADHSVLVQLLLDHARRYGENTVAAALVLSEDDMRAAHSWLCNVETLGIAPHSVVLLVPSKVEAVRIRNFANSLVTWRQQRRHLAPMVMPLRTGNFGLEFLLILREIVDNGVNVLRFRVNQVWLSNPLLYVQNVISSATFEQSGAASGAAAAAKPIPSPSSSTSIFNIHSFLSSSSRSADEDEDPTAPVDMVLARNSGDNVASGFMYIRATFNGRFFLSEIVSLLASDAIECGSLAHTEETCLVNALISGNTRWHSKRFPLGKWLTVSKDLFVDAAWYEGFSKARTSLKAADAESLDLSKTPYTSELSYHPVLTNLDAPADMGAVAWELRARHAGHWFTNEANVCDADSVHSAAK